MPAVFVHGVPDTHRVWRAVVGRLRRDDVVTRSRPGFGSEIPAGFDCTKDAFGSRLASRARARFIEFSGSHWWQLERPDEVAKELEGHWS